MTDSVVQIFLQKYDEFCDDLIGLHISLDAKIALAKLLSPEERLSRFSKEVTGEIPGTVLPGVTISESVWDSFSDNNKSAIGEYVRILSFCSMMETGKDLSGAGVNPEKLLEEMREKLKGFDFEGIASKFASMFIDMSGNEPQFKLPERFKKGQIAKLAEEIVKEIKPEDLGLTPEDIKRCESDPSKAMEILMSSFTSSPQSLQGAMMRVVKRLQEKFKRGEFRLEQLRAEAEELMKEFSENSAFVDMMEQFRSAFGFEDMDLARSAGREASARLSIARDRLRKKLEKRKAGAAGAGAAGAGAAGAGAGAK